MQRKKNQEICFPCSLVEKKIIVLNFYAPALVDQGHIVLLVSVCLSAENLTCELNIFL